MVIVVALAVTMFSPAVLAQSSMLSGLTGGSAQSDSDALNTLIEDAKADGSTVIVIAPPSDEEPEGGPSMEMSSGTLLKARANVRDMVRGAPAFPQRFVEAFQQSSYDGTPFWLIWAVGTALLGIAVGIAVYHLLSRWLRQQFDRRSNSETLNRADKLTHLIARGVRSVISTAVMFIVAILVAVVLDFEHEPARMTVFVIVSTYACFRILRSAIFLNVFAPDLPDYRMIPLDDDRTRRFYDDQMLVLLFSAYVFGFVAWTHGLGIDNGSFRLMSIVALALCSVLLVWLILRHRTDIFDIINGEGKSATSGKWRKFAAQVAAPVMLFYIVSGFAVGSFRLALGLPGGYAIIMAPMLVFVIGALIYAVAIVVLDRIYERRARAFRRDQIVRYRRARADARRLEAAERVAEAADDAKLNVADGEEMIIHHADAPSRADLDQEYRPMFKGLIENAVVTLILIFAVGELARLWGLDYDRLGGHQLADLLDSILIGIYAFLAFQAVNLYIDQKIVEEGGSLEGKPTSPGDGDSEGGVGESRLATLLPIFRVVFVSVLVIMAATFILSTWGVNVAPLFAGAGVVGLAVGFGAQTLIRDIFSGIFFLVDDAFRKGEYIEVGRVKGVVEKISIRSFQLRHHLGAIHTIPFGEITQLTNYSRDWVMMKLPLRLTYGTDIDKVRKLVKKLGAELLKHEQVGRLFLQPLKSQGVYSMEDSAMIVRVKFMTRPGDQFVTRKVVYQAIRDLFEKEGIKFAHREVTVRLADETQTANLTDEQKEAISGSVRSLIDEEEAKRRQAGSADAAGLTATER